MGKNGIYIILLLTLGSSNWLFSQEGGILNYISGSVEANGNIFIRDEAIGAANIPQYDRQLFGGETWVDLRYSQYGFDVGFRFDVFNNSNLLNPMGSYTEEGLGMWYVNKNIGKLDITAGYIYDQIGSGLIFRSYEVRPLLIDNAVIGLKLEYELFPNVHIKAFSGRQKQQFENYDPIVSGASIETFFSGGEKTYWSISPGIGFVNRTFDDGTVNNLISELRTYTPVDSIGINYNTYAMSFYNTLTIDKFTWFVETAYKTNDNFFDQFATKTNFDGTTSDGKFVNQDGYILYSSISYANKGFGASFDFRQIEDFEFRVSPFSTQLQGLMNYVAPLARQNTYRLTARYNAVPQFLGERAYQLDLKYAFSKKFNMAFNGSFVNDLDGNGLYRELYLEAVHKKPQKYTLTGGLQMQFYNQRVFEFKPDAGVVQTITPFVDFLYKLSRKKAIRVEAQYMSTTTDWANQSENGEIYREFGDWIFAQVEYSIAPKWIFFVSDMWNVDPQQTEDAIHYYSGGFAFTKGTYRIGMSYVKQVEGVVCTGGVCRLEPAFNGFRLNVNANF